MLIPLLLLAVAVMLATWAIMQRPDTFWHLVRSPFQTPFTATIAGTGVRCRGLDLTTTSGNTLHQMTSANVIAAQAGGRQVYDTNGGTAALGHLKSGAAITSPGQRRVGLLRV